MIIPCDTYLRLSGVAMQPNDTRITDKAYLRAIHLERRNGQTYAIACNGFVMAVEYLGSSDGPDERLNLPLTPAMNATCAMFPTQSLETVGIMITLSVMGFREMSLIDQTYPDWWAKIPRPLPSRTNVAPLFDADDIATLARSAPSQQIILQRHFDFNTPIIARDHDVDTWIGVFLPRYDEAKKPTEIPEWLL